MTLFRVLSDDESKKVTRWKAPELSSSTGAVANTRQHARPLQPDDDAGVRALLGSLDLKPGHLQSQGAAPRLQSLSPVDVFASGAMSQDRKSNRSDSVDDISQVSAKLLQVSYDEGYARGYADGNAALHQQSVLELNSIVSSLAKAHERAANTELEHELIALALDIAKLVIRREVSLAPEIMHEIVRAGLEQLSSQSTAQYVYLHPLDANIVRAQIDPDSVVKIVDDPSLSRTAVRIESGASVVHAGVENWLVIISKQLGLHSEIEKNSVDNPIVQEQGGSDVEPNRSES